LCTTGDEDTQLLLSDYAFCPQCSRALQTASPFPEVEPSHQSGEHIQVEEVERGSDMVSQDSMIPSKQGQGQRICQISIGVSTKLSAVVERISKGGPEAKDIVFSYWTTTLDILSAMLQSAGISYKQVDGRVSYSERLSRLNDFRQDPKLCVLLMSIVTGAVGLNLTAANRVHIVEPQWNPSVEEQAIARALRMGQTRQVIIFRYLMKDTVEQNIINLQMMKKNLAKFTLDGNSEDNLNEKLKDLKFVLNISGISGPNHC